MQRSQFCYLRGYSKALGFMLASQIQGSVLFIFFPDDFPYFLVRSPKHVKGYLLKYTASLGVCCRMVFQFIWYAILLECQHSYHVSIRIQAPFLYNASEHTQDVTYLSWLKLYVLLKPGYETLPVY